MLYKFLKADGEVCCQADDAEHLCPDCEAALRHPPDPYGSNRAAAAYAVREAISLATLRVPPSTSDVHLNPPDPYAIALERRRDR